LPSLFADARRLPQLEQRAVRIHHIAEASELAVLAAIEHRRAAVILVDIERLA